MNLWSMAKVAGLTLVAGLAPAVLACDTLLVVQYEELAAKAEAEQDGQKAWLNRRNAAAECPSYASWMKVGETAQRSSLVPESVDAYLNAVESAKTSQEQALALARYAEGLFASKDAVNASNYAQQARELDPSSAEVREIGKRIDNYVADRPLNPRDVTRSLNAKYPKPVLGRIADLSAPSDGGGGGSGSVSAKANVDVALVDKPKGQRIPDTRINFVYRSAEVDAESMPNVASLIEVLTDAANVGRTFVLEGHSDERGSPAVNLNLSRERAQYVYQELIKQAPQLKDRLSTRGRGATQPRYRNARDDAEHRLNRRLEVIIE